MTTDELRAMLKHINRTGPVFRGSTSALEIDQMPHPCSRLPCNFRTAARVREYDVLTHARAIVNFMQSHKPGRCFFCKLDSQQPEHRGRVLYECEVCGTLACSDCSSSRPGNAAFCRTCAGLAPNGKTPSTFVVNLHNEPYDVYIGRAGKGQDGYFGNPFPTPPLSREDAIRRYRAYFLDRIGKDAEFRERVLALKGKVLGCFCKPKPCHGDVIVEWLDAQP